MARKKKQQSPMDICLSLFFAYWFVLLSSNVVDGQSNVFVGEDTTEYASDVCNFLFDNCPLQGDGKCDDPTINNNVNTADVPETCTNGGDCLDCDRCEQYTFTSCNECVTNGCYWCPGNSMCSSVRLDQNYFNLIYGEGNVNINCENKDNWIDNNDGNTCASIEENNVFNDPLYDGQKWVFELMSIEEVWKLGYTGTNVHIRINDVGVDTSYPDINNDNFDIANSCTNYLPLTSGDTHGTKSAVIATGHADNNLCSVGVAPDATLSSCNVFDAVSDAGYALESSIEALGSDSVIENVDISSNSWGYPTCNNIYDVGRQRERRELQQQACPFRAYIDNIHTSPCDSCTSDDFSSSSASMSMECQDAIARYCSFEILYENDVDACIEYLDLYVECEYNDIQQNALNAISRGVTLGRNGLGIIYLMAAGNEYNSGADVNFEGWINTRFTIGVGSVAKAGKHASYSTSGAALFVVGPGGDGGFYTNHIGCGHIGVGTSYACPAVAGAIALILEAHPNLGWRDVQGLLASTAKQTDPDHTSWTINAAGFHHSYLYGFGLVDALIAINAGNTWVNYGPEQTLIVDSDVIDLQIVDDKSISTTTTLTVSANNSDINSSEFVTESVYIYLNVHHASRGDLDIVLSSPSGTESIMHPGRRPENEVLSNRWKLMTVRNWGENPYGEWKLSITDERLGNIHEGCIDLSWTAEVTSGTLTCALTESNGFCVDGQLIEQGLMTFPSPDGLLVTEACCICGGGQNPTDIQPRLESWRIIVHGRYDDSTSPPTSSPPANAPTDSPVPIVETLSPTRSPTGSPTRSPTRSPTSTEPTAIPNDPNIFQKDPNEGGDEQGNEGGANPQGDNQQEKNLENSDEGGPDNKEDGKVPWWAILLITLLALSAVLGCCICYSVLMIASSAKSTKTERTIHKDTHNTRDAFEDEPYGVESLPYLKDYDKPMQPGHQGGGYKGVQTPAGDVESPPAQPEDSDSSTSSEGKADARSAAPPNDEPFMSSPHATRATEEADENDSLASDNFQDQPEEDPETKEPQSNQKPIQEINNLVDVPDSMEQPSLEQTSDSGSSDGLIHDDDSDNSSGHLKDVEDSSSDLD